MSTPDRAWTMADQRAEIRGLTDDQKRRILALVEARLPVLDEIDAMVRERIAAAPPLRGCAHETGADCVRAGC